MSTVASVELLPFRNPVNSVPSALSSGQILHFARTLQVSWAPVPRCEILGVVQAAHESCLISDTLSDDPCLAVRPNSQQSVSLDRAP